MIYNTVDNILPVKKPQKIWKFTIIAHFSQKLMYFPTILKTWLLKIKHNGKLYSCEYK